jgi:hypothetical protein
LWLLVDLGLALSVVQWAFGWWTVAHMPAASEAKDAEGLSKLKTKHTISVSNLISSLFVQPIALF